MQLINQFTSESELNSFLKHVGKVREADSQPLRRGKLEQHVARLLGVKDWNTALGMVRKTETSPASCSCGAPLMPNGYCVDDQCIFHVCPQGAPSQHEEDHRLIIKGWFHSDDDRYIANEFDATPYFEELMKGDRALALHEINQILQNGGTGCWATDHVARSFEGDEALKGYRQLPGYATMVDYFNRTDEPEDDMHGFEVHLDINTLAHWVAAKHPVVFDLLSKNALKSVGL